MGPHDDLWIPPAWGTQIVEQIEAMLARDVDDDGLIESTIRLENSGDHQWSTTYCDAISFGWKCAWSNASLYHAWSLLAPQLERLGRPEIAERLEAARLGLKSRYVEEFFNPGTGLIAGWRSQDGAPSATSASRSSMGSPAAAI